MMWLRKKFPGRALLLMTLVLGAALSLPAQAQSTLALPAGADTAETPDWLEPRGLSVLDLVGEVPEEHLRGSILVFDGAGVTRYLRGNRDGDQVTIEVSMSSYQNLFTEVPCLGRRPLFDEWPVTVPKSEMRIYSAGRDITGRVFPRFWYFPAAQEQPIQGADLSGGRAERYDELFDMDVIRTATGALAVPANMGCTFFLYGSFPDLTAKFVFDYPQQILVETLGSQTFTFHSYVGPGGGGRIDSLAKQLDKRFGNRHDKFPLDIPPGADYVWLNYPPTPVSPYAASNDKLEHNILLPSSGTYRLIGDDLSTDHVVSMGLPLSAQWVDADLDGGSWLRKTGPIHALAAPEYFVPPGILFDPCMQEGECSDELLDRIYNTTAEMTLYYYRVRRLRTSNLTRVPLRQVAGGWRPGAAQAADGQRADDPDTTTFPANPVRLPLMLLLPPPPPPSIFPDDGPQEGCPCGWFDENFRMLDVIPGLP